MLRSRRILQEFKAIVDQPEPGWTAELYYPNDLYKWKIYLDGPSGTPYENGKFQLFVIFSEAYPFKPPEFRFNTRIFHPNITFNGHLSINILNSSDTYSSTVSIRSVVKEIISLLRSPDSAFPLCSEAAFLFSEDQPFFYEKATSWTIEYATNDEIVSSCSNSPKSIQNAFSPAESDGDSSHSSTPNRSQWLFKSRSIGTEVRDDPWRTYSKSDQCVLEHAYQCGQSFVELDEDLISFSTGLQVNMNYEEYIVKRLMSKPRSRRRKYNSLAFSRGECIQPIPIIDQCLSPSVSTCVSAVIDGIRREGLLHNKQAEAEEAVKLLEEVPKNEIDLIGLRCVHLYTRDSFIHRVLNKFLRDQDFNKVQTLGPFVKLLYSQFDKYSLAHDQAESLMVYRGTKLNSAELRAFKRGTGKKSFYWLEFLSTSKDLEVAKMHAENALLIIRLNKLYKDRRVMQIQKLSQFEEELEVLFRPGVEFSIETWTCDDEENKKHTFHLDAYT